MYKNVNGKLIEMTETEIAEEKQKIQLAKAEEKSRPPDRRRSHRHAHQAADQHAGGG